MVNVCEEISVCLSYPGCQGLHSEDPVIGCDGGEPGLHNAVKPTLHRPQLLLDVSRGGEIRRAVFMNPPFVFLSFHSGNCVVLCIFVPVDGAGERRSHHLKGRRQSPVRQANGAVPVELVTD